METYSSVCRCIALHKKAGQLITIITLLMLTACSGTPQDSPAPITNNTDSAFQVSNQALDTVVKLSWSSVPSAAGYLVYRDGSQVPLNPKPMTVPAYEDIGLTNGRIYSHTVAAVDTSGKTILQSADIKASPKSNH